MMIISFDGFLFSGRIGLIRFIRIFNELIAPKWPYVAAAAASRWADRELIALCSPTVGYQQTIKEVLKGQCADFFFSSPFDGSSPKLYIKPYSYTDAEYCHEFSRFEDMESDSIKSRVLDGRSEVLFEFGSPEFKLTMNDGSTRVSRMAQFPFNFKCRNVLFSTTRYCRVYNLNSNSGLLEVCCIDVFGLETSKEKHHQPAAAIGPEGDGDGDKADDLFFFLFGGSSS